MFILHELVVLEITVLSVGPAKNLKLKAEISEGRMPIFVPFKQAQLTLYSVLSDCVDLVVSALIL